MPPIALYDPLNNPLLTGAAARLNMDEATEARDAYARVAETLLGLSAPAFTDATDVQKAKDAVAVQVTHMIAAGAGIFLAKSESRGARSVVYRDDVTVNPMARLLAEELNRKNRRVLVGFDPSRFVTVVSLRGTASTPDGFDVLQDVVIHSPPIP